MMFKKNWEGEGGGKGFWVGAWGIVWVESIVVFSVKGAIIMSKCLIQWSALVYRLGSCWTQRVMAEQLSLKYVVEECESEDPKEAGSDEEEANLDEDEINKKVVLCSKD
ncbi:hypothetical protein DPMN_179200 [Dreissena polymorpha]|uniref:Uncharacterized protein n=1 Tax=Dreissena polymorpha TaxID=45954 RepID=A0A9D4EGP7_DREPO|nr:hypothetical protein DPMN_179200 [Dreissena polymorpha]